MRGGVQPCICQVSPLSSGPMKVGGGVQPVYKSGVTSIIRAYERGVQPYICHYYHQGLWRWGGLFSRYISHVSPASSGPIRGGLSWYICQVSPLSSGSMRGGGVQPGHLSSVSTIIRAYEGGGISRYISPVSPLSPGPMREGFSLIGLGDSGDTWQMYRLNPSLIGPGDSGDTGLMYRLNPPPS
jgi:hypothetical protein